MLTHSVEQHQEDERSFLDTFKETHDALDKTGIYVKIREKSIPKGVKKVRNFGGKKARKIAKEMGLNVKSKRGRRALQSAQKDLKILGRAGKIIETASTIMTVGEQVAKGYENLQKDNLSGGIAYCTEAIFRSAEVTFNSAVEFFVPTAIAFVILGTTEITVPVLFAYMICSGEVKEIITPLWDAIEDKTKPMVRDYFQSLVFQPSDEINDALVANAKYTELVTKFDGDNTISNVDNEGPHQASIPIVIRDADSMVVAPRTFGDFSDQIPVFYAMPEYINDMVHEPITFAEYILAVPDKFRGHAKLEYTKSKIGENVFSGMVNVGVALDEGTSLNFQVGLSGLFNNSKHKIFETSIVKHLDICDVSSGVVITQDSNGQTRAGLSLGASNNEGTAIKGAVTVGGGGIFTSLALSSTNPALITFVAVPLAGYAVYTIGKEIVGKFATKPLPFENKQNKAFKNLSKKVRWVRKKSLNCTSRQELLSCIDKCEMNVSGSEEDLTLLKVMKFKLQNANCNPCKRWYEQHNFEKDFEFYNKQFNEASHKILNALRKHDIVLARQESANMQNMFPDENTVNQWNALLYDEDELCYHAVCIIKKDMKMADDFFDEAFKNKDVAGKYASKYAHCKFGLGHYAAAQSTAAKIIGKLSIGKALSSGEIETRDNVLRLCIASEIAKPIEEQSSNYLLNHVQQASSDVRTQLSNEVNAFYIQEEKQIYDEMQNAENNMDLSDEARRDLLSQHQGNLITVNTIHYQFARDEYQQNDELFNATLHLSYQLGRFDETQELINRKLSAVFGSDDQGAIVFSEIAMEQLVFIRDMVYQLGINDDLEMVDSSIKTLHRMLTCENLPQEYLAKAYCYIGDLLNKKDLSNRMPILRYYEKGFDLNPNDVFVAERLANEYYRKMQYDKALDVLQAWQNSSDNKELANKYDDIYLCKIKRDLFFTELNFKIFRLVGNFFIKRKFMGDGVNSAITTVLEVAGCAESVWMIYLRYKTERIIDIKKQRDKINVPSEEVGKGELKLANGLNMARQTLPMVGLGLQVLRGVNNNFVHSGAMNDALWYGQLGHDVASCGSTAYSLYENAKPLSELTQGDLFDIGAGTLCLGSQLARLANRHGFQKWREEGRAPEDLFWIAVENIAYAFDNELIGWTNFLLRHATVVKAGCFVVAPFITKKVIKNAKAVAIIGSKKIAAGASYAWTAGGLYGQIAIVGGGVALVGLAVYAGYRGYYYCWYNNKLHNTYIKMWNAQLSEFNTRQEIFNTAQKSLNDVLKSYPEDAKTLELCDMLSVMKSMDSAVLPKINSAIEICNRRISDNSEDVTFRKMRIKLNLQNMANSDIDSTAKKEIVTTVYKDFAAIADQDKNDAEIYLKKIEFLGRQGKFAAALHITEELKERISLSEDGLQKINEIAKSIGSCMLQARDAITGNLRERFADFCRFLHAIRAGELVAYGKALSVGANVWRSNELYRWSGDDWLKLQARQRQPGDLVEVDDGYSQISGDAPFVVIQSSIEDIEQASTNFKQAFSKSAITTWTNKTLAHLQNPKISIFGTHRAKVMSDVDVKIGSCDEGRKSYRNGLAKRIGEVDTYIEDVSKLLSNYEKQIDKSVDEIDQEGSCLTNEHTNAISDEKNRIKEKIASDKTQLAKDKNKLSKLNKQLDSSEDIDNTLANSRSQIENQLDEKIETSITVLCVKTLLDVVAQGIDIFMKSSSANAQRYNERGSYCNLSESDLALFKRDPEPFDAVLWKKCRKDRSVLKNTGKNGSSSSSVFWKHTCKKKSVSLIGAGSKKSVLKSMSLQQGKHRRLSY